jgi:hypothetical protein
MQKSSFLSACPIMHATNPHQIPSHDRAARAQLPQQLGQHLHDCLLDLLLLIILLLSTVALLLMPALVTTLLVTTLLISTLLITPLLVTTMLLLVMLLLSTVMRLFMMRAAHWRHDSSAALQIDIHSSFIFLRRILQS